MPAKASRSGNPAVRATAGVSSPADFKQRTGGLLTLPSGFTVKVQNKGGMRSFLQSGMIPNSLMGVIHESIEKGKEPTEKEIAKLIGVGEDETDLSVIEDMLEMTNRVVCNVVVEPEVHPVPADEKKRNENLLYVDELSEEDRMFIFQWVTGGTRDIERFRKEQAASMDALAASKSTSRPTKRAPRTRK